MFKTIETVVDENPLAFATSRIVTIASLFFVQYRIPLADTIAGETALGAATIEDAHSFLLGRLQRVLRLLKKFILQLQAGLVGLHRLNCLHDGRDPGLHIVFAKLAGCR